MTFLNDGLAILQNKSLYRARFEHLLAGWSSAKGVSVADFGGVNNPPSNYRRILDPSGQAQIVAINIDPSTEPDVLRAADDSGLADGGFDAVWCFNLLEHVPDPHAVIAEVIRVCKPDGLVLIATPFLLGLHGFPDDFSRYSPTWYRWAFKRYAGLEVEILSIGEGPFFAALNLVLPYVPRIVGLAFYPLIRVLDGAILWLRKSWSGRWPLGYLVVVKPSLAKSS